VFNHVLYNVYNFSSFVRTSLVFHQEVVMLSFNLGEERNQKLLPLPYLTNREDTRLLEHLPIWVGHFIKILKNIRTSPRSGEVLIVEERLYKLLAMNTEYCCAKIES